MSSQPRTCAECGSTLGPRNASGYCARHANKSPATRAKISAALIRAHRTDPTLRERKREGARRAAARPGEKARRSEQTRRIQMWKFGLAAITPESRTKGGKACSATKLAWCPPHLRGQYRDLTKVKGMRAAEARALILEQHETEMRRWRRSVGAEPPPPPPVLGGTFFTRASAVAARWADVASLWNGGKSRAMARARWAVFLALRRGGWTPNRIGRETGMDRKSVEYGLAKAEVLAAAPGEFAELFRKVAAA